MAKLLRVLGWGAVAAAGAVSVLVAALHRGESINALWLVTAGVCTFAVAYRFYSTWLMAKVLVLDERRAPPSITQRDGKDFVPTNKWVVFGHHFAAIAGPGPLVGPVLAAQFGYLPGMLWILIGATLGGGVHDAVVLFASMRRVRQVARPDAQGGGQSGRRHRRHDQPAGDHDDPARRARPGRGQGAGRKPVGAVHHRHDDPAGDDHGRRAHDRKGQRAGGDDLRRRGPPRQRVGRRQPARRGA